MNRIAPASRSMICLAALGIASPGLSVAAAAATEDAASTAAEWHPQQMTLNYSGFTTLYTCDGLEDKVRQILLSFGARKDLKVRASGCNEGSTRPSRIAWVRAEFNTLAPATDPAAAATVKSKWVKVRLEPNRPDFMGAGECELVEQMKDMLQKGFKLRNADYRTSCVPHQVSIADYSVTAEVLKSGAP
jgi:hypothetical protein